MNVYSSYSPTEFRLCEHHYYYVNTTILPDSLKYDFGAVLISCCPDSSQTQIRNVTWEQSLKSMQFHCPQITSCILVLTIITCLLSLPFPSQKQHILLILKRKHWHGKIQFTTSGVSNEEFFLLQHEYIFDLLRVGYKTTRKISFFFTLVFSPVPFPFLGFLPLISPLF